MKMLGLDIKLKRVAIGLVVLPVAVAYLTAMAVLLPIAALNLLGALFVEWKKECAKACKEKAAVQRTEAAIEKSKKIVEELTKREPKPKAKSKKKK
jgi:hypothetical protein